MMLLSIGKVANMFGVCTQTIRNWSKDGLLNEYKRTLGNHRRYSQIEVEKLLGKEVEEKKTLIYILGFPATNKKMI